MGIRFKDAEALMEYMRYSWDYERNNEKLEDIELESSKYYWWICLDDHRFRESPKNLLNGIRCPYDSGLAIPERDHLTIAYPEIATEWDIMKNGFGPKEVLTSSKERVWWICPICGKSYLRTVKSRVKGHACPACCTKD